MTLFDENNLFQDNASKIFDQPDAELMPIEGFFSKEEAVSLHHIFLNQTQWWEFIKLLV